MFFGCFPPPPPFGGEASTYWSRVAKRRGTPLCPTGLRPVGPTPRGVAFEAALHKDQFDSKSRGPRGAHPGSREFGSTTHEAAVGLPPFVDRLVAEVPAFFADSLRKLLPVSSRMIEWCTKRSMAAAVVIASLKIRSH